VTELAHSPAVVTPHGELPVLTLGRPTPAELVGVVDAWLTNRRLSEHTREAYRRDVLGWLAWCSERLNPLTAGFFDVNTYARELEAVGDPRTGRTYAPSTVARKLSALSSWYAFLTAVRLVDRNPADQVDRPEVDRDHSTTVGLSAQEAAALKRAADLDPYACNLRTRALIRFLLDLGVRVSEATGARIADLRYDSGHRRVKVRGKGGKIRWRRVPPELSFALDAMLTDRAAAAGVPTSALPVDAPLFATAAGLPMDRASVTRLVRRLARNAGIPSWESISPHSLRHAFATIARDEHSDLEDVQDAMGHADPRTTRRYDRDRGALRRDPSMRVADATDAALAGGVPPGSGATS